MPNTIGVKSKGFGASNAVMLSVEINMEKLPWLLRVLKGKSRRRKPE